MSTLLHRVALSWPLLQVVLCLANCLWRRSVPFCWAFSVSPRLWHTRHDQSVTRTTATISSNIQRSISTNTYKSIPRIRTTTTGLCSSLKPAALPLMDAGKSLARSGELWIDLTSALDLYGGSWSAAGAQIRNAGDAVAQAAASCRFKTGAELVCDELREAATCLRQAATQLQRATQEFDEVTNPAGTEYRRLLEPTSQHVHSCSDALEAAGAGIMKRDSIPSIGFCLIQAGRSLQRLALDMGLVARDRPEGQQAGQRMQAAAEKMIQAGIDLGATLDPDKTATTAKSGKGWLKG